MLVPIKNIPLYLIIESICNKKIIKYDNFGKEIIIDVINLAVKRINKKGIESNRPNEVGNYSEPYIISAFHQLGYDASIPKTNKNHKKSTGYPDVYVNIKGREFYIEIKTFNMNNIHTTQRSFYLSPNKDFKITKDAYHLIFAFSICRENDRALYRTDSYKILDAKDLLCDVKYEFNSDNKRMYSDGLNIIYEKKL